jgi:hypothetical protein
MTPVRSQGSPSSYSKYIQPLRAVELVLKYHWWPWWQTMQYLLYTWLVGNWRIAPARRVRRGFRKFSGGKIHTSRARGAPARVWQFTLPGSRSRTLRPLASSQSCDRKSKFGLRHRIKLNSLYTVTKSEFWFSMIPPSYRGCNLRSFVPLKFTVTRYSIQLS